MITETVKHVLEFFILSKIDDCPVGWGWVEYTDCTSAEGSPHPTSFLEDDTKQSDGEVPVMQ